MRWIPFLLLPVWLGLAFLLAGCSGGGGGEMTPGVTLLIGADTGAPSAGMTRNGVTLQAPLDGGSTVTVYDFRTGAVIRTGTLGSNGFCSLSNIPTGLTVAIVATGTHSGNPYRLSTLIANVPNSNAMVILTPETSLAAEVIAQHFYLHNQIIDQATFNTVLIAAQDYVDANPGTDYSIDNGVFQGSVFGDSGSLGAGALASLIAAVPGTIDNNVVLAKNAVQQFKEAGFTLHQLIDVPPPDMQAIFTATIQNNYQVLGDRLLLLLLPVAQGAMDYYDGSDWHSGVTITDLTVGSAYQVTTNYGGYLEIAADPAHNTAGQITLIDNTSGTAYTLVARQVSALWQLTQTSAADPQLLYRLTFPALVYGGTPGVNPDLNFSVMLQDANFTTPLAFQGSISATGSDVNHYTKITFDGTLTTPQVTSGGTLEIQFPSTVPSGARPGAMVYDFPTSFSMTGANIVLHGQNYNVVLTGAITAASAVVTGGDGYKTIIPRSFSLSGGYADTRFEMDFHGLLTANWANPATDIAPNTVNGTVNLDGTLARDGFNTYTGHLHFALNAGQLSSTLLLESGAYKLTGTGSATLTATGAMEDGSLTLTNQAGVVFTLGADSNGDPTGTVTVNGTQVATITSGEFGGIKILYTDGTFDEIG